MASLVPFETEPRRAFGNLRREMSRLMEDFFGDGGGWLTSLDPRTDVAQTDSNLEIKVDLPGMKPEDFDIQLRDRTLWISGQRKEEMEEKGKTYQRMERYHGAFRRAIPLDCDVDAEHVTAEYKDGVLRITVPKAKSAQAKKIEVKT